MCATRGIFWDPTGNTREHCYMSSCHRFLEHASWSWQEEFPHTQCTWSEWDLEVTGTVGNGTTALTRNSTYSGIILSSHVLCGNRVQVWCENLFCSPLLRFEQWTASWQRDVSLRKNVNSYNCNSLWSVYRNPKLFFSDGGDRTQNHSLGELRMRLQVENNFRAWCAAPTVSTLQRSPVTGVTRASTLRAAAIILAVLFMAASAAGTCTRQPQVRLEVALAL